MKFDSELFFSTLDILESICKSVNDVKFVNPPNLSIIEGFNTVKFTSSEIFQDPLDLQNKKRLYRLKYLESKKNYNALNTSLDTLKDSLNRNIEGPEGLISKMCKFADSLVSMYLKNGYVEEKDFIDKYYNYLTSFHRGNLSFYKNLFEATDGNYDAFKISGQTYSTFEEYLIDYYLINGEDGSYMTKLFKECFKGADKCSYSGRFADFTDWQNIMVVANTEIYTELVSRFGRNNLIGKTLSEVLDMVDENSYTYQYLLEYKAYGCGDFVIDDVLDGDNSSFSGFVFQDKDKNYFIAYNCSEMNLSDASYDGILYAKYFSENMNSTSLKNLLSLLELPQLKQLDSELNLNIQFSEDKYRDLAINTADKYIEKSRNSGTKLYVGGYSLGGSLAEYSSNRILEVFPEILGEIVIFNGLNANLSVEEFERMKSLGQDKFHMYTVQGDMVSKYIHEETFEDYAINIEVDYKKVYETSKANPNNQIYIDSNNISNLLYKFVGDEAQPLINFLNNGAKYIKLGVMGGCHSSQVGKTAFSSFDENGKAINGRVVSLNECSQEMFGCDLTEMLNDTLNIPDVKLVSELAVDIKDGRNIDNTTAAILAGDVLTSWLADETKDIPLVGSLTSSFADLSDAISYNYTRD